jgi:nucleoid-associated protein YgaU
MLRTYTVQSGDTLSGIAQRELGDASRWPEILERNREVLSNLDRIVPDQVLILPT